MKIAFRHVPFSGEERNELNSIAAAGGYDTLWLPDDVPTAGELEDCGILMGYFPPEIFKKLPGLRWVQIPAAGAEKYCGDIYARRDVVLTNCSGAFGTAIAEYLITGLLMLMRNMHAYGENQKRHDWRCAGQCRSICGSTVAVVGMGDIGTCFAQRIKALGAAVRGVRRTSGTGPACFDEVYTSDRICEAVTGADAVVACLPGTPKTVGLISAEVIAHMDTGAILCNCGRGCTVDESALIRALENGRIAGAVLDVFENEPLERISPLWDMPNVIVTPHISGRDEDPVNAQNIFGIFKENLRRWIAGRPLTNVVDREAGY